MQIGYTHSAALYVDEPIVSSDTGTLSAIERNGHLIARFRFWGEAHMNALWRDMWQVYGQPAGHSDRPYITIKRDNAQ